MPPQTYSELFSTGCGGPLAIAGFSRTKTKYPRQYTSKSINSPSKRNRCFSLIFLRFKICICNNPKKPRWMAPSGINRRVLISPEEAYRLRSLCITGERKPKTGADDNEVLKSVYFLVNTTEFRNIDANCSLLSTV